MNTASKVFLGISGTIVAGLVAVAVSPAFTGPAGEPTAASEVFAPTHMPTAGGANLPAPTVAPGECAEWAWIKIGSESAEEPWTVTMIDGRMEDRGPREFAMGEVHVDDDGYPATYTVARGDVTASIGDRFCIKNGIQLDLANGYKGGDAIQPGDVLTLNADLITDYVYPYAG